MYETSIGIVLFRVTDKVEFLLMQRSDNKMWDFPKGHHKDRHHTENEKDVALRELKEETQITEVVFFEGYRHEYTFVNPRGSHRQIILFLCQTAQEPVLSDEHVQFKWVQCKEACQFLRYEEKVRLLIEVKLFLIQKGFVV